MAGIGGVLAQWELDLVPTGLVALVAIAYLAAWRRLARDRPTLRWPAQRAISFAAGLLALIVAVDGPPDALAESSFSMHMLQHLLLMMVAVPLLVLGAPVTLLLRADPAWFPRRHLAPVIRSRWLRVATHPVVAFGLLAVVLVLTHLSSVYESALESELVHEAEHVAYLTSAAFFWTATVGAEPVGRPVSAPARMFLLLLSMPIMALLGLAIVNADELLYPFYDLNPPPWGATPMADQELAGALMWTVGMIIMPAPLVMLLRRWFAEDERAHARLTARQDATS